MSKSFFVLSLLLTVWTPNNRDLNASQLIGGTAGVYGTGRAGSAHLCGHKHHLRPGEQGALPKGSQPATLAPKS